MSAKCKTLGMEIMTLHAESDALRVPNTVWVNDVWVALQNIPTQIGD